MIEKSIISFPIKFSKKTFFPNVFGEFQIGNCRYFVIGLDNYLQHHNHLSALPFQAADCLEVGRFTVNGQLCAIVKIDDTPAEMEEEVDISTLLTERELQIATLVAQGRPNKQIAHQLHISEWTVSTHLRRIFVKLGVDSRAAMVYRCASLIQQLRNLEAERT